MTAPTVQVLLDNFTGAFPFDITAYLEPDDITISRGRPDEFSQASAGSLSLTLDNTDGRFTLGSATYGIGLDQQIRIVINGVNKWTGYVQSWPVSWPGGGQSYATVQVDAVDAFARLARTTLHSSIEEDIRQDNPLATYPLSEEAGATIAADTSRNGASPLQIAGTGTPFVFGSGTGPTDGLTCASFAGGTFLRNAVGTTYIPAGSAFTLECWFATTQVPASAAAIVNLDDGLSLGPFANAFLTLLPSGKLQASTSAASVLVSPAAVNDGLVHHAMATLDAGGTFALFLDGVNVAFIVGVSLPLVNMARFSVAASDFTLGTPYVGTVAHASIYSTALSSTRASRHAGGTNDHTGEGPASRISRIAGYCGLTTGFLDGAGNTTMGAANQTGRNALDVVNEIADATLGFIYLDGSGAITSQNGYTVVSDVTADSTIDAAEADPGTTVAADMAFVVNEATGSRPASENTFSVGNTFSQAVHGVYNQDFTWNVNTDDQVVDRTNWIVSTHAGPQIRFPSLSFHVLNMTAPLTTQAMALDISAFLHVTGLPPQVNGIADLIVQGITWRLSRTAFDIEVNCTLHNLYAAWILQDATWGVLDGTTKLYAA